ncbi:MAG: hypothetical protein ACOYNL_00795 [Rickettsiales bacterium]
MSDAPEKNIITQTAGVSGTVEHRGLDPAATLEHCKSALVVVAGDELVIQGEEPNIQLHARSLMGNMLLGVVESFLSKRKENDPYSVKDIVLAINHLAAKLDKVMPNTLKGMPSRMEALGQIQHPPGISHS